MLTKEVCQKCMRLNGLFNEWTENDEKRWKLEVLDCPNGELYSLLHNDNPPEWCGYKFEHSVGIGREPTKKKARLSPS